MKNKIEPEQIDTEYLDGELNRLFKSIPYASSNALFNKYRSRFTRQQMSKDNPFFEEDKNSMLSVGKKLEILCAYGNHRIVKMDRKIQA